MKKLAILLMLGIPGLAVAQEAYLELVRSDLQNQKVQLVTAAMELSDEASKVFWPIYREYQLELSKIGDRRIALLKEYAENIETLSNEKTAELMEKWFSRQQDRLDLLKKYYEKMSKELSALEAARFVQVEAQIQALVDVQIGAQVPLVGTKPQSENMQDQ